MALRKCPKCELNYIRGDAPYCDVCMREMKRGGHARHDEDETDEIVMCSECGEAPAVPGSDLCADCLKEQKRQADLEDAADINPGYDDEDIDAVGDDERE